MQDGFQLYQHNFILTRSGNWAVVQQGMNPTEKKARRYHWCSSDLRSFVEEPHTAVVGDNRGKILNLTDKKADGARNSILEMSHENPERMIKEIEQIGKPASQMILMQDGMVSKKTVSFPGSTRESLSERDCRVKPDNDRQLSENDIIQGTLFPELEETNTPGQIQSTSRSIIMPAHHDVQAQDVDLKRLGGVLATAYESQPQDFESLLLTPGLGPRTLQSLALVSEVIYGTPSRFTDPARFSFAHGGKDGHPFPVPLKIYDESIRVLRDSIEKSKLGYKDKSDCIRRLHQTALNIEKNCAPQVDFDAAIKFERQHSKEWDGKTV